MNEFETSEFLLPLPIMPSEENTFAHYTIACRLPGVIAVSYTHLRAHET